MRDFNFPRIYFKHLGSDLGQNFVEFRRLVLDFLTRQFYPESNNSWNYTLGTNVRYIAKLELSLDTKQKQKNIIYFLFEIITVMILLFQSLKNNKACVPHRYTAYSWVAWSMLMLLTFTLPWITLRKRA